MKHHHSFDQTSSYASGLNHVTNEASEQTLGQSARSARLPHTVRALVAGRVLPLIGGCCVIAMMAGGITYSDAFTDHETMIEVASLSNSNTLETQGSVDPDLEPKDPTVSTEPNLESKTIKIGSGDTLMRAITRAGADRVDAHNAIQALSDHFDPRKLRPGHILTLTFDTGAEDGLGGHLALILFRPDPLNELIVVRNDIGEYVSSLTPIELSTEINRSRGTINSSLIAAANQASIPRDIIQKFIDIYSYGVDFQRELQPGDTFEVLYETRLNDTGDVVSYGNILFAELTLSGDTRQLYRFENEELGPGYGYFDYDGHSAIRALMRTPINGARLSSGFGNRRHPILGYKKKHKGVDFAAPTGTPILAAGDGVIDKIGRNGAYGKYIRIRHNDTFQTAYAHMSRYGKGLTRGSRVHQGKVIGYVGSTGRSTGAHLHYEILMNGRQVNPRTVALPTTQNLEGSKLKQLRAQIKDTQSLLASTPLPKTVAAR